MTNDQPTRADGERRTLAVGRSSLLYARQASYDLLARLYLGEPDVALAHELRELGVVLEQLPAEEELAAWIAELAAEHQRLFGMNVYPYESIFVDRELLLNTAAADRAAQLYRDCGFDSAAARVGAPDHLGLELSLMAALIAAERRAEGCDDRRGVEWARHQQARCLHSHLACWAPLCALAIDRVTVQPLYHVLARLTTELVLSDLGSYPPPADARSPGEALDNPVERTARPARGTENSDGEDERGVSQIVRELITPDCVGVLLTRADIRGRAGALDLPIAIGDRFQMLRGLFEAAGRFDQLLALLDALATLFAQEDLAVAAQIDAHPAWGDYGQAWRRRIAHGRALLAELRAQAIRSTR